LKKRSFNREAFEHFLQQQEKQELVEQLGDLFEKFEVVSDYYRMALRSGSREVLTKYKDKLEEEFFVENDEDELLEPDIDKIYDILEEFERLNPRLSHRVELSCFAIELVCDFEEETDAFLEDYFYEFFEELFEKLLYKIKTENQLRKYHIYLNEAFEAMPSEAALREPLSQILEDFYN